MKLRTIGTNQSVLEFKDGQTILFSYETPVAVYTPGKGYERTELFISRTTNKHVDKWIGREPARTVSQEAIALHLNDRLGSHVAPESDDDGHDA